MDCRRKSAMQAPGTDFRRALAAICLTLTAIQFAGCGRKTQPIAYNHKKHIELGVDCAVCHTGIAEKKTRAGIPNLDVCMTCHGQEDNPNTQIIRNYAAKKILIPWRQVHSVPAHVYFSHRRHVAIAGLDCAVCHGDMSKMTAPVVSQAIPITMARCIECHKKKGVTTDCLACHH